MRGLKYIMALGLPVLAYISFTATGWFTFLPLIQVFLLIPLLEVFMKPNSGNHQEAEEAKLKNSIWYDLWVYLAVAVQLYLVGLFLYVMHQDTLTILETVGRISAMGLLCGVYGINVAHELGHRVKPYERMMAKVLLLTSLYMHFIIEHNRGHHKYVSTPDDPATSRKGEWLYVFWFRSVVGSYLSAWKIQQQMLDSSKRPFLSLKNEMLLFHVIQLLALIAIFNFSGPEAMVYFVLAAVIGILLLETVNYIEHYGLLRKMNSSGNYERVLPQHSWNSDHILGRLMLFELSRHSDHHYQASRKYQILRSMKDSPQMPTGYPGMILLALVPPLWFIVMHKRMKNE
ncbi:MAG: alkane 1-monooxygenase, partial [Cyclobacteriaceae bacterium]